MAKRECENCRCHDYFYEEFFCHARGIDLIETPVNAKECNYFLELFPVTEEEKEKENGN